MLTKPLVEIYIQHLKNVSGSFSGLMSTYSLAGLTPKVGPIFWARSKQNRGGSKQNRGGSKR